MPILATAQKETQFTHAIQALLQRHLTGPPVGALEKHFGSGHSTHKNVDNILEMSDILINALTHDVDETDGQGRVTKKEVPLNHGNKVLLITLACFRHQKKKQGEDALPSKWTSIAHDQF